MTKVTLITFLVLICIVFLVVLKKNENNSDLVPLKEKRVILAFGDSLTYGFGANYESSYPKLIEKKTGFQVINAGINGELSGEGLKRLPNLLREYKPDIVILCHGGNDIINRLPASQLKDNLLTMIQLIEQSGAEILFIGVPDFGLFSFDTHEVYKEIADEKDLLYEEKVLTEIALDHSLKSDYVHPNERGYELMANTFIEILQ